MLGTSCPPIWGDGVSIIFQTRSLAPIAFFRVTKRELTASGQPLKSGQIPLKIGGLLVILVVPSGFKFLATEYWV